jgi:hypothetical protein
MKNRGWTEDTAKSDAANVVFKKGDNAAGISTLPVRSTAEVTAYESFFPGVKDKIKAGQTLIFLVSGPANVVNAS